MLYFKVEYLVMLLWNLFMTSAAEFVSEEHESCVLQNENWNYKFSQVVPQWDIRIFDYLP